MKSGRFFYSKSTQKIFFVMWFASIFLSSVSFAGEEVVTKVNPDKWSYNLFNPTPKELMREMATDRPDKTESPISVDAGHFQLEMDFATYTHDKEGFSKSEAWNIAPMNLKMGLLNNVDLQVVMENYVDARQSSVEPIEGTETTERQRGFGDITTRLKVNFLGNDGGEVAFGMIPFIKAPTNSANLGNKSVEGGIILPVAAELPEGWSVGAQFEYDFVRNDDKGRFDSVYANTISFGHDIVGDLAGYVEFFSAVNTDTNTGWEATVDAGLTYAVNKDIQLDCGCNFGVTRAAADYNPFVGISVRY